MGSDVGTVSEHDIRLQSLKVDIDSDVVESRQSMRNETALAPQDNGYAAWSFLIAAAVIEAIVWSIPFSFGVLLQDYLDDPKIASQPHASTLMPLVGTLSSGVIYCSGPLVYPYMSRHRKHIRPLMWLGMMLCWTSILISSYSRKVYQFVIFQGIMYGIGGGLIYPPCILYMSEWFFKRRGLANGVLFAGTAVGGLIMPFILPPLVKSYGLYSTLRIIAIGTLVTLLPCMVFIRPRLPEVQVHAPSVRAITISPIKLRDWSWWSLVCANIFQGFAFFLPTLWLPTFASTLRLNSALSSLALALMNGSAALGPLLVGVLSDHFTPWPIALILSVLSCLCTLIFWGSIGGVVGLMLFGATYGLVAGGWSTLWSAFVRRISKEDPWISMSLYGFLMLTRGLGNVLSTPISTALAEVQSTPSSAPLRGGKEGFVLDGGRYARLIAYVSACFGVAAIIALVGWAHDRMLILRPRSSE